MAIENVLVALAVYLLLAGAQCQSSDLNSFQATHYVRVDGADATCHDADLHHGATKNVKKLQELCDANEACSGFNSDGMLKRDISIGCQDNDLREVAALYLKSEGLEAASQIGVVPLPVSATQGTTSANLASQFVFMINSSDGGVRQFMSIVTSEYMTLMMTHQSNSANVSTGITGMNIIVDSTSLVLGLSTDESYKLSIPSSGLATLTAPTVFGARHGLETFSQLVHFDVESGHYLVANTPIEITDQPRFPHRGVLLDTFNHYISIPNIKQFISSLSYAKLNVMHWHIVDNRAFPLQLHTLPKLVEGAFSPYEIYTPEDVVDIVEYAKYHGVRVLPEFDTPGHAASWCVGHPEICPSTSCTQPLNPATNVTFDTIGKLILECTNLFPDDYFHLGGDEVNTSCWTETPSIATWLQQKNFTADDAYRYFVAVTHTQARSLGRKSIHWEEVFNHFGGQLDKDTIFQVWLNHATAAKIVAAGYQCILSNQDVWYLNFLLTSWQQVYANDPYMGITDPKQQKLMLGGEVCMWTDVVDNSDLFNTAWPRAAAGAERLWSAAAVKDTDQFAPRLAAFHCLLTRRGVGAAAVNNKSAGSAPPRPGSCFPQ